MNEFLNIAINEAKKAQKNGDVPVGAVIIKNNKVISKAYNKKENKKNAIKHAEILAISKACKKLKKWYLDDCILYVTLEPCMMCCGAIVQSRLSEVYYGTASEKFGYIESVSHSFENKNNHKPKIIKNLESEECKRMLIDFFKNKRKK